MKCKEVNKNMLSFLDGDLKRATQEKMQNHLSSCLQCQSALKKVKNIYSAISIEKDDFQQNDFMAQKIWGKIHSNQINSSGVIIPFKRLVISSIAAAGIAFGVGIGTILNSALYSSTPNDTEQAWSQLADDYFPNDLFSPYDELNGND